VVLLASRANLSMPDERSQRLMLRIEAGGTRFAVDATQVLEVAAAPAGNAPLHGNLALEDLSARLGGPAEVSPTTALVFDTSPTLGLRVGRAPGVVDATGARYFMIPKVIARALEPVVRGVLELGGQLHFELDVEELARAKGMRTPLELPRLGETQPAASSLVFSRAGRRFAVPLPQVRQVVPTSAMLVCPLEGGLLGLVEHGGRLWPVWSPVAEQAPRPPGLAVLIEQANVAAGLAADSAEGVRQPAGLAGATPLDLAALFS